MRMNQNSIPFSKISPPPDLTDVVYAFWEMQLMLSSGLSHFRVMADGRPGMLIPDRNADSGSSVSTAVIYGQTTQFDDLYFEPEIKLFGVVFHPHIIKSLFGFNADEITDQVVELDKILPIPFHAVEETITEESVIAVLRKLKEHILPADNAIRESVEAISSTGGKLTLRSLHRHLRLSERQFERRFKKHIGITPVLFSRISRFQAALRQIKSRNYMKLSDVAFDRGYADQAHFIREFKEFSGFSPGRYHSPDRTIAEICKL